MFCAQTDGVNKDLTVFCLLQEKKEMHSFHTELGVILSLVLLLKVEAIFYSDSTLKSRGLCIMLSQIKLGFFCNDK